MNFSVSVVIRTKNESKYLDKVLKSLKTQIFDGQIEIIIVDSGSTDNTLSIAKSFDCKIIEIRPEEFSFGKALNIGIKHSLGEIIINLSGHSVPETSEYISLITAPFSDKYLGATFGRDIPWPEACPSQARDILNHFPDTNIDGNKFSNANAAIRKSCWEILPFDEEIPAAEDLLWAKQIMSLGYKIQYVPKAKVYHSHTASLKYIRKRAYIESKSLNALANIKHEFNFYKVIRFSFDQIIKDFAFVIKNGYNFKWLFHIPFYRASQSIGLYKGFRDGFHVQINQIPPLYYLSQSDSTENNFKNCATKNCATKKGKKIIFVIHCFFPESVGGSEYYTLNLAKNFMKRGWNVIVLTALRDISMERYKVIKTRYEGIDVIKINNPSNPNFKFLDYFIDFNVDKIFKEILEAEKPDLIHFQHTAYLSSRMPEICHQQGIPSILTLHDYWYICYRSQLIRPNEGICPGPSDGLLCSTCNDNIFTEPALIPRFPTIIKILHLSFFRYIGINKLISPNVKNKIKKFLYIPAQNNIYNKQYVSSPDMWGILEHTFRINFMRRQLSFTQNIISPSQHLKKRYENEGYEKIIYLPHGFEPQKKVKKISFDGKLVLAYLSNIIPFKGADVILRELRYVTEKEKLKILIYGKVLDNSYLEELKSLAKMNPEVEINFAGIYKGIDELAKILQSVHAVIFPSIWEENHPLIVKESHLFGVPVICSYLGGAKEAIEDGVNGLLFNPLKEGDLAEKINLLIKNPNLLEKLIDGAKKTDVESMEEHLNKIETIYLNIYKSNIIT